MNLEEFYEKYKGIPQKDKIDIICDICGTTNNINKEKAEINIKENGCYVDRSCATTFRHIEQPMSQETKDKIGEKHKGKVVSSETKAKMSAAAKAKWETLRGIELKRILSEKATKQNENDSPEKYKRKVLYKSAKNNSIVICQSSYEFIACEDFLELDENVVSYVSQVSYQLPNGHFRSLDFILSMKDGNHKVIEVKPKDRINDAAVIKQITDNKDYALKNNYIFEVWTEDQLKIPNSKWAIARADEYRKINYEIDLDKFRKYKHSQRSQKYYQNHIQNDCVVIFCEYCETYHKVLRRSYEKNMEKNPVYVCEKFGGHLAGSKPKLHLRKYNPYAAEGKKMCLGHNELHSLEEFGNDKSRRDGKADSCKKWRAEINKKKYQEKQLLNPQENTNAKTNDD